MNIQPKDKLVVAAKARYLSKLANRCSKHFRIINQPPVSSHQELNSNKTMHHSQRMVARRSSHLPIMSLRNLRWDSPSPSMVVMLELSEETSKALRTTLVVATTCIRAIKHSLTVNYSNRLQDWEAALARLSRSIDERTELPRQIQRSRNCLTMVKVVVCRVAWCVQVLKIGSHLSNPQDHQTR